MLAPSLISEFFNPWNDWLESKGFSSGLLTVPSVNIMENDAKYQLSLAAPGLTREDFQIDVEGNVLTIRSEKEEQEEQKEGKYTRKEYGYASFVRSFSLPEDVKQERIDARYKDGVLTITLPRKEEARKVMTTKKVAVQ